MLNYSRKCFNGDYMSSYKKRKLFFINHLPMKKFIESVGRQIYRVVILYIIVFLIGGQLLGIPSYRYFTQERHTDMLVSAQTAKDIDDMKTNIDIYRHQTGKYPVAKDFLGLQKAVPANQNIKYYYSYESDGEYFILTYPDIHVHTSLQDMYESLRGTYGFLHGTQCGIISSQDENKLDPAVTKRNCDTTLQPNMAT